MTLTKNLLGYVYTILDNSCVDNKNILDRAFVDTKRQHQLNFCAGAMFSLLGS